MYDPTTKKLNHQNMREHFIAGTSKIRPMSVVNAAIKPFNTDTYPDIEVDVAFGTTFALGMVVGM